MGLISDRYHCCIALQPRLQLGVGAFDPQLSNHSTRGSHLSHSRNLVKMARNPSSAPSSTAWTKTTSRKPYVRIVTDKRREQNRRAQKTYRDRLKKKLEVLEEQAAATLILPDANDDDPDELLDDGSVSATDVRVDVDVANGGGGYAGRVSPTFIETQFLSGTARSMRNPKMINLADAFAAAGDLPFGQGSPPGIQFQVAPPTPEPEVDEVVRHTHDDYGDIDMRTIWAYPARRQQYPTPSGPLQGSKSSLILTPRRSPGEFPPPLRSTIADPYVNHMHLLGEGNLEASLSIGYALKISKSQYVNDHPSHFPSCYVAFNKPDPRSPTNSTSSDTVAYKFADGFMNVTRQLQEHLDGIKAPLRPTPAQMLHPHPTYLDCIVFPRFRELAVKASADGILDHHALFMDLINGALVCWGGMSGLSNRHGRSMKSGKRDMRDSVAWSARSWEAKRWFLKKWTWMIGSEEDEEARGDADGIWKGSRWWWTMRGEEDSDEDEYNELSSAGARASEVEVSAHCL